jgi:hypothetical protein
VVGRDNIDYIVDYATAALKGAISSAAHSPNGSSCNRTHLVVNAVFDAVGDQLFAAPASGSCVDEFVAPIALLKDMVMETIGSIDMMAVQVRSSQNSQV